MKYLNLVVILLLISCGEKSRKSAPTEESESMEVKVPIEINDDDIIDEEEIDHLEAAMDALDNGNSDMAVEKIMLAVANIRSYVSEMDDPVHADNAIETLLELATKIKNGRKMSGDDLEEALLKLEMFSIDELDVDPDYNVQIKSNEGTKK